MNIDRAAEGTPRGTSGDRLLAVLKLFSIERPEWTAEAAAERLRVSVTTAYRYFRRLTGAGLISPVSGASYMLGPAIIEMDWQIQHCDPMLRVARGVMANLVSYAAEGSTILLCRLFHDRVMCIHQVRGSGPQPPVSYERGRPMPLFRGATSKIILAHLPPRTLNSLFTRHRDEIVGAGLGLNGEQFRRALAAIRRAGTCVTHGDVDTGLVGIAAPIFDHDAAILGSLSFVLPSARADDALIGRLSALTAAGAHDVERAMRQGAAAIRPSPPRIRVAR